ncbi:MAG TPA: hypothetical protein VMH83_14675, partial [Candidatus Acidoferrum sp.]|nr:hypothetical protein [Candidatus Acidoferrum sp.]
MDSRELEKLVMALTPSERAELLQLLKTKVVASHADRMVNEQSAPYTMEAGEQAMEAQVQLLIEKFIHLSPEKQAEVEDFVEFLHQQQGVGRYDKLHVKLS